MSWKEKKRAWKMKKWVFDSEVTGLFMDVWIFIEWVTNILVFIPLCYEYNEININVNIIYKNLTLI